MTACLIKVKIMVKRSKEINDLKAKKEESLQIQALK